jgi:hypothetical protein
MDQPRSKPRLSTVEIEQRLQIYPQHVDYPLLIVGIRGFYRDMGQPGMNDRGIYDDAIFIVSPNVTASFNANTDPSKVRIGQGTGATKGMASLAPGFWPVYKFDLHKGRYLALCQRAGPVTVLRDGKAEAYEDRGNLGINIHKGGYSTTGSEGCQTIPPDQWPAFIELAQSEAVRLFGTEFRDGRIVGQSPVIPYVLLEAVRGETV